MGRPLRPASSDAWFHVMNRGAARRQIYFTRADARHFLDLIAEGSTRFAVDVHAFCLMTNHYHLLVRSHDDLLPQFMHHVGANYTRAVHTHLGTDGPIFRGRYHAIILSTADYVDHVGRYIHRNPLDLPGRHPADYEWSSLRHYLIPGTNPPWLHTDTLLDVHGGPAGYREFVLGERCSAAPGPWEWAVSAAIAELADDAPGRANLSRSVAVALRDAVSPGDLPAFDTWLGFADRKSLAKAVARARARVAADPLVAAIADRAGAIAG